MNKNHSIEPGTYIIDIADAKDVQSISVKTNVVPKPPPRMCVEVEIMVVRKSLPGGGRKQPPATSSTSISMVQKSRRGGARQV